MAGNLKQKTVSGAMWSGIHKFAAVVLHLVSGVVLARLLTPSDYGVIGMLTIFLAICRTFIDGGFGSALIQKKRPTDVDYSTILYWNLGLSVVLYFILYFSAPFIAKFYDLPILSEVLRVLGITLIINAARIVQHNQLRKRLEFKKVALINIVSSFIALVITIYLAWKGWGVWALVAQQLLLSVLCTLLYWITARWRPVLVFSRESFRALFSFGGFVLLSNLFNTLCNNIQGLLIGKVYNSSTLGFYSKARSFEHQTSTFISSVLDQVSYPVLSEAQDEKKRMVSILKRFTGLSAFCTFPVMLLLILLARPIFLLLYGERWLASVPYFQLLCLAGISICLQNINYYAVAALGRSRVLFRWTFFKRTIGLALVVGGLCAFGIYGLLVGTVISAWLIYAVNSGLASKYVGYKFGEQMYDLLPILACSCIAFLAAYLSTRFFSIGSIYIVGLIRFIVFLPIYFLLSYLFKLEALTSARESAVLLIRSLKSRFSKSV